MDDEVLVVAEGRAVVTWTSAMSTFMLKHMAALVEGVARTSTGFKMMHYNGCARAMNEHFRLALNGPRVSNHYRTIKKKFQKIKKITDDCSGALWDDKTCTLRMEHDMALGYIEKNKLAAEYINIPIENYHEMQTLYGDHLATGKYAKGSSEPIGTAPTSIVYDKDEVRSSATKPAKKAKKDGGEEESHISTLRGVSSELDAAIVQADAPPPAPAPAPIPMFAMPDGLYETVVGLPGYSETQAAHYYIRLVENPPLAVAFMKMSSVGQLSWMTHFLNKESNT